MFRRTTLLIALLTLAACGGKERAAKEEALSRSQLARQRAEFALQSFDQKMALLRQKADASAGRASADTREALALLEEKKTAVQMKLEELKISSLEAGRDAAQGLENAVDDMERSTRKAADRFK